MTRHGDADFEITPEVLLKAYACGIFPMAESADDQSLFWVEPERRGILPLDRFHVPRRPTRAGRAQDLDQCAHPPPLWRAPRPRPLPFGGGLARRQACGRALRRQAEARLLRREHVPPRNR